MARTTRGRKPSTSSAAPEVSPDIEEVPAQGELLGDTATAVEAEPAPAPAPEPVADAAEVKEEPQGQQHRCRPALLRPPTMG